MQNSPTISKGIVVITSTEVRLTAEALTDRTEFVISLDSYNAFLEALDAPPSPKPRLDRLLNTPCVLTSDRDL